MSKQENKALEKISKNFCVLKRKDVEEVLKENYNP